MNKKEEKLAKKFSENYEVWRDVISDISRNNKFKILVDECGSAIYNWLRKNDLLYTYMRCIDEHYEIYDNKEKNKDTYKSIIECEIIDNIFRTECSRNIIYKKMLINSKDKPDTKLIMIIKYKFINHIKDTLRINDPLTKYYVTCRNALKESPEIALITKKDYTLFSRTSNESIPEAPKYIFSEVNINNIPVTPYIEVKNITNAKNIVKSALFFWDETTNLIGKYYIPIYNFVQYIHANFDLATRFINLDHLTESTESYDTQYGENESADVFSFIETNSDLLTYNVAKKLSLDMKPKEIKEQHNLTDYEFQKCKIKIKKLIRSYQQETAL